MNFDGRATDTVPDPELFQLMVDSVRDYAMFLLDTGGRVLTWNVGAHRIKGYLPEEIIGRHFSVFYPASEVRAGKPEYELRVAAEVGRFEDEGWRIRQDGTRFWGNVIITAVRNKDGELVAFAKVTRDLSDRKRAEDERILLLESERAARHEAEAAQARLEALQIVTELALAHVEVEPLAAALTAHVEQVFAAAEVGILLDEEGDLQFVAHRGASPEDVVALERDVARRVAARVQPVLMQEGGLDAPSGVALGSLLSVPLRGSGGMSGVLFIRSELPGRFREDDLVLLQMIADRVTIAIDHARAVEAERAAVVQMRAAEESLQVRNEFISIAAHELKTPLTALSVAAQMAARKSSDPASAPLLTHVTQQARRLNRLVVSLLEASRIDLGKLAIQPEETDVRAIVTDVVEVARQMSGREVHLEVKGDRPAPVDPLRFEQAVLNLVDNALKYSPNDAPVEVSLDCTEDALTFTVRDHGNGIPEEMRERVFERFFQAHKQNYQSGLGLGLYITRQIIGAHGGEITAEFPEDGGTRFVVSMPGTRTSPLLPSAVGLEAEESAAAT